MKFVPFTIGQHFKQSIKDKWFFYQLDNFILVTLYVDDLLVVAHSLNDLNQFWTQLERAFNIRTMSIPFFQCIEVCYFHGQGLMTLSQKSYIAEMATWYQT